MQTNKSWDPNYIDLPREFEFNVNKDKIKEKLKQHYAKLLSKGYKESTGKTLKSPEDYVNPRFGYVL